MLPIGSVVYSSRASIGKIGIATKPLATNQGFTNFICKEGLSNLYLTFALKHFTDDIASLSNSTTFAEVSKTSFKSFKIPFPPLREQEEIVTNLHALFTRIDKAIQLIQENLEHINHLLAAALNDVFENAEKKGWFVRPIEKVFKIRSGEFLSAKMMTENASYDVYGGNGINGKHTEFNLQGDNIIIGRVGAKCGNVRLVKDKVWITDNAFFVFEYLEEISKEYLSIVLKHLDLGKTANQAAQPVISYKGIKDLEIPIPNMLTQEKIVKYVNDLKNREQELQQKYNQKLHQLKSLKASLLDAAFRGELTQQATKAKVIQLPTETLSVVAEDEVVYQNGDGLNKLQKKKEDKVKTLTIQF
ncbi:MAG: restriction endonuclease subunit S [Segetibacter sp.]